MAELLPAGANKYNLTASQRVPPIARPFVSERALNTLDVVCVPFFYCQHCRPSSVVRPCPDQLLPSLITSPSFRLHFEYPPVADHICSQVEKFVDEECIPADAVFAQQLGTTTEERFSAHPPIIEDLKLKAKKLGLWNLFLPKAHFKEGAGFSNLEYGLMAELLGKSATASEVRSFL